MMLPRLHGDNQYVYISLENAFDYLIHKKYLSYMYKEIVRLD